MSIRVMTWVWKNADADPAELLVLLAIADNADDDGTAWPSKLTLARKCRMSERNVSRMTSQLAQRGLLKIDSRQAPGGRGNRYTVTTGRSSALPATGQEVSGQSVGEETTLSGRDRTIHAGGNTIEPSGKDSPSEVPQGPAPLQRRAFMDPPTAEPKADYEMNLTQVWKLKDQLKKKPTTPVGDDTSVPLSQGEGESATG